MASKELKEERRALGLCVYCGRPAVIKADGTQPADASCAAAVMCARNVMQGMASRHGAELQAGREDTLSKSITRGRGRSW